MVLSKQVVQGIERVPHAVAGWAFVLERLDLHVERIRPTLAAQPRRWMRDESATLATPLVLVTRFAQGGADAVGQVAIGGQLRPRPAGLALRDLARVIGPEPLEPFRLLHAKLRRTAAPAAMGFPFRFLFLFPLGLADVGVRLPRRVCPLA